MDQIEVLTLTRTTVDDEVAFLDFALRNPRIRLLRSKATLTGPVSLSIDEYRRLKVNGTLSDCQVYLWNTGISQRLRWSPVLTRYDATWSPIDDEFGGSPMRPPRNKAEFEALHFSFRRQPIHGRLFRYGRYLEQISPVLVMNISSEKTKEKTGGLFRISAQFSNYVNKDIWLCWNSILQAWEHEIEDVDDWADSPFEQPAVFGVWQATVFDWLKKTYPRKIVPESSYQK